MSFLSDLKQKRDNEQLEQEFITELKKKPMPRDQFFRLTKGANLKPSDVANKYNELKQQGLVVEAPEISFAEFSLESRAAKRFPVKRSTYQQMSMDEKTKLALTGKMDLYTDIDQFSVVEHILWKDRDGNIKKTGDGHKVRFLDWSRERGYEDWQKREIRKREKSYRSAKIDIDILIRQIDGKE